MSRDKILIIDDSKLQGIITKDLLVKNGYEVVWVSSAEEAMNMNFFHEFDLILLDVILPGMNGYDVCKIIKDKNLALPVIMLTSMEDEKSVVKALNSGADDYIKKPFSINELLARICVQIRTRKLQMEILKKNEELKKANDIIKKLAATDMLTGAYNRVYMREYMENIDVSTKDIGVQVSCIMLDIDNFKKVNDVYGHLTGDKVLKNIADICKKNVQDNGVVIRFGGEEFLIIVNKNVHTSLYIAEKIRSDCENSSCCECKCTVSLGLNEFVLDKQDIFNEFEEGIRYADKMLYISKNSGKNKVSATKKVRNT